jgi:hypothetical protein
MMKVERKLEEITIKHIGREVLIRVKQDDKEFWTNKYHAKIWGLSKEGGKIALTLGDGAMLQVTREMIMLKD